MYSHSISLSARPRQGVLVWNTLYFYLCVNKHTSADRGLLAGGNRFIIIPAKTWLIKMKHFQVIHTPPNVRTCTRTETEIHWHTHVKSLHIWHAAVCVSFIHEINTRAVRWFVFQADEQVAWSRCTVRNRANRPAGTTWTSTPDNQRVTFSICVSLGSFNL